MHHIYGTTKETNDLTPVSLSPVESENEGGMATTADQIDITSAEYPGTEQKKPSLLNKVKNKAKKLKSKLKPGHGKGEGEGESPTHDDDTSSSSSDEQEDSPELGYAPLSSSTNVGDDDKTGYYAPAAAPGGFEQPSGTQSTDYSSGVSLGTGYSTPHEDRKFGLLDSPGAKDRLAENDPSAPTMVSQSSPLSQFKSAGPAGAEQAVPTAYNYYNKDPGAAAYKTPSPAALGLGSGASRSLEETPSALGEQSAGTTSMLSNSRTFGSGVSEPVYKSVDRPEEEDKDAKIPVGMLAPGSVDSESRSRRDDDSLGRSYDQDVGMEAPSTNVTDTLAGAKDAALEKVGYGSTDDQTPTSESQLTDTASSEPQKPIHQRAYEGLTGAAVGMGEKLGVYRDYDSSPSETTSSQQEPTMAQKAYDTVVGTKDAAADKLGYGNQSETGGTLSSYTPGATDGKPVTQKAYDTVVGAKDAAADKLAYGNESTTQQVTGEPTMAQKAYDTIVGSKETQQTEPAAAGTGSFFDSKTAPVSEFNNSTDSESKPVGETATSWKDSITRTLGLGGSPTATSQSDRSLTEPTETSTDSKPLTEKARETGVGVVETVATKLGYEGSATHTPSEQLSQNTKERAVDAKNIAADKIGQADVALSSDSTPISQKAASTLSPTEHDKALSQSVTESISNLPTLLTEKLGFGSNSAATNKGAQGLQGPSELDVPVSEDSSNLNPAANTPTSPAASPGIVNRVTGAVSSLFGGNKKLPAGGEEYSPSNSGEAGRDITDTTPMVTDLSGVDTHRSSPAAA